MQLRWIEQLLQEFIIPRRWEYTDCRFLWDAVERGGSVAWTGSQTRVFSIVWSRRVLIKSGDCATVEANHKKASPPPPPPPSTPRPPTAKWKDRGGWNEVRYSGKRQDGQEHSRSFSHVRAQEPADEQQQVQEEHFFIRSCLCKMKYADTTVKVLTEDQILIKKSS